MISRMLLLIFLFAVFFLFRLNEALLSWIEGGGVWALLKKPNPLGIDLIIPVSHVAFVVFPGNDVEIQTSEKFFIVSGWPNK